MFYVLLYMFYVLWCLRLTSHLLNDYDDVDDDETTKFDYLDNTYTYG